MKILAGSQLWRRKARQAPVRAAQNSRVAGCPPCRTASTPMLAAMMAAMPAARPSRPSIRLTALVMPTIHSTDSAIPQGPRSISPSSGPRTDSNLHPEPSTTSSAAAAWTISLVRALSRETSSRTPSRKTRPPPATNPVTSRRLICASHGRASSMRASAVPSPAPAMIAAPPRRGVGSGPGPGSCRESMAPSLRARLTTRGTRSRVVAPERRNATRTRSQG